LTHYKKLQVIYMDEDDNVLFIWSGFHAILT
jgi:hypothetical protein